MKNIHLIWVLSFLPITAFAAPPQKAIDACADLAVENSCTFTGVQGDSLTGSCQMLEGTLACQSSSSPNLPPENGDIQATDTTSPQNDVLEAATSEPETEACVNLTVGSTCQFQNINGDMVSGICEARVSGICEARVNDVKVCLTEDAPDLLMLPKEIENLPPPSLPSSAALPSPPLENTLKAGLLLPPPLHLPGTVTRSDDLRQRANLFNLNWQAQQNNINAFIDRVGIPQRRSLPQGEQVIMRVNDDEPIYYGTDNPTSTMTTVTPQTDAANSTALWTTGVTSTGTTCLGEWDVGAVLSSHQEFGDRVTLSDASSNTSDHSTHVAGTMIASGVDPVAQGIAYQACLHSYDWEDAESEMAQAAADGLRVSNHSYGVMSGWVHLGTNSANQDQWCWYGNPNISTREDYKFGFYANEAKNLDQIAYDAPYYLIVKAAGNDRSNNPAAGDLVDVDFDYSCDNLVAFTETNQPYGDGYHDAGYDTLMPGSTAKNILTIGAVDAAQAVSNFSAWGPTDDGRIKPDLVAFGQGVYSTSSAGQTQYTLKDGTSMASPAVASSLGLIQHYYQSLATAEPLRATSLKALALHTATDLGAIGPDYQTGWGALNNAAMVALLETQAQGAQFLHLYELSLGENQHESIDLNIPAGTTELRATLVWHDPAGHVPNLSLDPSHKMLVNDLDLRVRASDGTIYQPWVLNPAQPAEVATMGDNSLDNVEQVRIQNPISGNRSYQVQISHKNSLDEDYQAFSLIVSGNTVLSDVELDMRQNDIALANDSTFSFGTLAQGNRLEKTFTLYNRGSATLAINDLTVTGEGFSVSQLTSSSLNAGDSANFTITATGSADGELSGTLRLSNNDADESTFSINLVATVEAAGTVNDFGDSLQVDGKCTLREAIANANADQQIHVDCPVTDNISLPSGTYTLSLSGTDDDENLTGDLDISRSVTIRGAGMDKTIIQAGENAGNGIDRVLHVPTNEGITLDLQTLSVRYGNTTDGYGGGVLFDSSNGTLSLDQVQVANNKAQRGGGVYVDKGTLNIAWSSIADNNATSDSGNGGGGINCSYNCTLSLLNSAVVNNNSEQFGGAIIVESAIIQNSTISGNSALAGGGLMDTTSQVGTISLNNVTLYNNESLVADYPAGLMLYKSNAEIKNSIIAGNTSSGTTLNTGNWNSGIGTLTSLGHNLSDNHDWTAAVGDLLDKDLEREIALAALHPNDGTTLNHLPAQNSLALDAANACDSDYDQRAQTRSVGDNCDIGAVEGQAEVVGGLDTETSQTAAWQRVLNWAEVILPDWFPAEDKQTLTIEPYQARFYPNSSTYAGYNAEDGYFYAYNPTLWGDEIIRFETLSTYLPMAEAAGF